MSTIFRRGLFIFLVCLLMLGMAVQSVAASGEQFKGELNSWGTWAMSGNLGGTFLYTSGQVASASDSVSEFKFFQ